MHVNEVHQTNKLSYRICKDMVAAHIITKD